MDRGALEQLLDELLSSMETLETRTAAILQFLKDEEHATEDQLAPYMEQAGNASNVRWRAARLRMMSLLNSATKDEASGVAPEPSASAKDAEPAGKDTPASATSEAEIEGESAQDSPAKSSAQRDRTPAGASGQSPETSALGERKQGLAEEEESPAPQPQETIQSKDSARTSTTTSTPAPNRAQSQKGSDVEQKAAKALKPAEKTEPSEKEDAA